MDHAEIEGEIARKENNKSCEINREGEEKKTSDCRYRERWAFR